MKKLRFIYARAGLYGFIIPIAVMILEFVFVLPNHIGFFRYFAVMFLTGIMIAPSFMGVVYVVLGQYQKLEAIRLNKKYSSENVDESQYKDEVLRIISEKLDYYDSEEDKKRFMVTALSEIEMIYVNKSRKQKNHNVK